MDKFLTSDNLFLSLTYHFVSKIKLIKSTIILVNNQRSGFYKISHFLVQLILKVTLHEHIQNEAIYM